MTEAHAAAAPRCALDAGEGRRHVDVGVHRFGVKADHVGRLGQDPGLVELDPGHADVEARALDILDGPSSSIFHG